MRKFIDIALIVAGSFMLLSCLVFITAYFLYLKDVSYVSANVTYEISEDDAAEISSIFVDAAVCDVKLVPSEKFMITGSGLSTYEDDHEEEIFDVKLENGLVSVKQATNYDFELFDTRFGFEKGYLNSDRPRITIYYPDSNLYDSISITSGLGDITLGDISCQRFSAKLGVGSILANGNIDSDNLSLNVGVGKIDCKSLCADRIKVNSKLGFSKIGVGGKASEYSVTSDSFIGYLSSFGDNSYVFVNSPVTNIAAESQINVSGGMSIISIS